jgi:hypothetical protein
LGVINVYRVSKAMYKFFNELAHTHVA